MQTLQTAFQDKKPPLVSFVIPCHNLPPNLVRECLASITALSLSRAEREIIVVDDGSDVPLIEQIADYRDDIVYVRQPRAGLGAARNTGIDLAKGDFIQFVDGDDRLVSSVYDQCLDLVRYDSPDLVLFRPTLPHSEKPTTTAPHVTDGATYMTSNNIRAAVWSYVFRRQILDGLRFTPGLLHEDEEFTPQLFLRVKRMFVTDHEAYYYRRREASITTTRSMRHTLRRLNDYGRILTRLNAVAETLPAGQKPAMERRVAQLTMDYIYNIIILTHSRNQLRKRLRQLSANKLYPLPRRAYTLRYALFRSLANSKGGLHLLEMAIPMTRRKDR